MCQIVGSKTGREKSSAIVNGFVFVGVGFVGGLASVVVWSPGGRRLAWSLDHDPPGAVYVARADGRGTPGKLTSGFVTGWSRIPATSP